MDKIIIQGLKVKSLIGVYDWERNAKQDLLCDIELELDLSKAAKSDDVSDTINYAELASHIESLAETSEFQLLESLAQRMCSFALGLPSVKSAKIGLTKPKILPNAQFVKVELLRKNS